MWRIFVALSTALGHIIFSGDAKDAYAHLPGISCPTFARLDDAFIEWYFLRCGKLILRDMVLPILCTMQGHPESGRLWQAHVTAILVSLGWRGTTHEKNIY